MDTRLGSNISKYVQICSYDFKRERERDLLSIRKLFGALSLQTTSSLSENFSVKSVKNLTKDCQALLCACTARHSQTFWVKRNHFSHRRPHCLASIQTRKWVQVSDDSGVLNASAENFKVKHRNFEQQRQCQTLFLRAAWSRLQSVSTFK